MRKKRYPGIEEAERMRYGKRYEVEEPDFVGGAPNYEKFIGWSAEEILVWLNID